MASILDQYGIKEVCDFVFYDIDTGNPVLYLDTLKISTVEQTGEVVYAQGGKGNPKLIGWDYGKDITVNLEDALFSPKSMAVMFGDGKVNATGATVMTKTIVVEGTADITNYKGATVSTVVYTDATGATVTNRVAGEKYFATFDVPIKDAREIVIGPNTFPGTYRAVGDTFARAEKDGDDEFFQLEIKKAKILSENTLTMEAEGDPSVFNMDLSVLRHKNPDGTTEMMRITQYALAI